MKDYYTIHLQTKIFFVNLKGVSDIHNKSCENVIVSPTQWLVGCVLVDCSII